MISEFKVRVNKEESEKIQELLINNGFSWYGCDKKIRHLDCNYIYSSKKWLFLLDDEHYFNKCTYKELTVEEILGFYPEKDDNHNAHYKAQKIDTITRCKANMTLEQQKAICIFQIDRYTHREKGQNLSDIKKIRDYLDWLEEIEIGLSK
jgi:hypothetical protein